MKMLGNIVREARQDQKLTIRHVAKIMGIHPTFLGRIELSQKQPTRRHVLELSEILKTDQDELIANYLSERIVWKIKNERLALQAISLAEQKIKWLDAQNQLSMTAKIKVDSRPIIQDITKTRYANLRTQSQKQTSNQSPDAPYTPESQNNLNMSYAAEATTPTYRHNHENKKPKTTE